MASKEHCAILSRGVLAWNTWRRENETITPDLRGAILSGACLNNANLAEADLTRAVLANTALRGAVLRGARLVGANLSNADLRAALLTGADLSGASLLRTDLSDADLCDADLGNANFIVARLTNAKLTFANLRGARLLNTNFERADLSNCQVHGVSVWDAKLTGAIQSDLVITPTGEPGITVDNLNIAQFVYLLLNNQGIREVIETITSKLVLILGRFKPERKAVLDALREELRRRDYLPVMFDFGQPATRNLTETVSTLAHLARFVIADLTDPCSIPQELQRIVPDLPSVPVQPLLLASNQEYAMFRDLSDYSWVLPPHRYETQDDLCTDLAEYVIAPAERRALDIEARRRAELHRRG